MKQSKERVIAIDYFRGICILVVILSHSYSFSLPFAYLSGLNQLWVSAAEMFFLLSGIIFAIVRGPKIVASFGEVLKKTWRRAGIIYLLNIVLAVLSLCIGLFLSGHSMPVALPQQPLANSSPSLLIKTLDLSYNIGWANFLMFFAVFLLLAPFALYVLYRYKRLWVAVPVLSIALFAFMSPRTLHYGGYSVFAVWQVYFFLGMTIARFRQNIIGWFYRLKPALAKSLSVSVVTVAAVVLAMGFLINFNVYSRVARLTAEGWLPAKLQSGYASLLQYKPHFNSLLMDNRTGILRPAAALLVLLAAYLVYQKFKQPLLRRTGRFVNAMGRDTLWIFAAQALAIPLLAALPVRRDLLNNFLLTSLLFSLMWAITQRRAIASGLKSYSYELQESFYVAKSNAMYRRQDDF